MSEANSLQRLARRPSPRERVAKLLCDLGIETHEDDITSHRSSILNDTGGYWEASGSYRGNPFLVSSNYHLKECARGFRLVKNGTEHCLYGDAIAIPSAARVSKVEEAWKPNVTSVPPERSAPDA